MKRNSLGKVLLVFAIFFSFSFVKIFGSRYNYEEKFMQKHVDLSPKLRSIFKETRLVCFGRYALEIPFDSDLIIGDASFPSPINVVNTGGENYKELAEAEVEKILKKSKSAQITYSADGPINNSWQIRYYEDEFSREFGLHFFKTYRTIDDLTFILTNSVDNGETEEDAIARESQRIINLRKREVDDVPRQSGYCIEQGFIADGKHVDQEMVSAGIYIPSFPDVAFSARSNKDAYADYPKSEFEQMKRDELPLLKRIKQAQDIQGDRYPGRTVLREGKRAVQHWLGEESLIKRSDGTHDFEWSFVGTPKDVANPSVLEVTMFTKVAHNTVGAADKASLTDDEAVALWDKLLSGLKFRVKVPGAPEGSYYFLPGEKTDKGANP